MTLYENYNNHERETKWHSRKWDLSLIDDNEKKIVRWAAEISKSNTSGIWFGFALVCLLTGFIAPLQALFVWRDILSYLTQNSSHSILYAYVGILCLSGSVNTHVEKITALNISDPHYPRVETQCSLIFGAGNYTLGRPYQHRLLSNQIVVDVRSWCINLARLLPNWPPDRTSMSVPRRKGQELPVRKMNINIGGCRCREETTM